MGFAKYARVPVHHPYVLADSRRSDVGRIVLRQCLADIHLLSDFPDCRCKRIHHGFHRGKRIVVDIVMDHTAAFLLSLDYVLRDFQELFQGYQGRTAAVGCPEENGKCKNMKQPKTTLAGRVISKKSKKEKSHASF